MSRRVVGLTTFSAHSLRSFDPWDPNAHAFRGHLSGLTPCTGNDPDVTACNSAVFTSNPVLTTVDLGNVNSVRGTLFFSHNPNLATLLGTAGLTRIDGTSNAFVSGAGNLDMSLGLFNTGLTSLAAFSNLTSAAGVLAVTGNPNLSSLGGLTLTGDASACPFFFQNPKLDYCEVKAFVTQFNAACTVWNSGAQLKEPCDDNTCAPGDTCQRNCDTPTTHYDCVP